MRGGWTAAFGVGRVGLGSHSAARVCFAAAGRRPWRAGRDRDGRFLRTLAAGVYTFVFEPGSHTLFFLANGRVERFDGHRLQSLVRLSAVGLSTPLTIQPVGALVALRGRRRLVVIRRDGG